jgi:cholesterol oxidase
MGLRVAILERGHEILPGEFPRSLGDGISAFQADLGFAKLGSDTALFDLHTNNGISVLVGCGVGGTSLINGNVMLHPDARVFDSDAWPKALRDDRGDGLQEGYARAKAMLTPAVYPDKIKLAKLEAFRKSAGALDTEMVLPPINVTFEDRTDGNIAGMVQPGCTLCGDCCSGCNVGSKNTIPMNYLPDAIDHGAELFTGKQVRHISRDSDTWVIHFRDLDSDDDTLQSLSAGVIVLGAGTLGSTEILLRSKENGLDLSSQLGKSFSGNGDVISFGYNCDDPVDAVGVGHPPVIDKAPVGPVIAGLIDLRDTGNLDDGMVIQEGAIPSVLAPALPELMASTGTLFGTDTDSGIGDFFEEKGRQLTSMAFGAYSGAVNATMTFLVMAHDGSDGQMRLDDDRIRIDWDDAGKRPVFQRISETLEMATAALGGTYVDNPAWSEILGRNLVSVHPLGGCTMGDSANNGVVDHKCRIFSGNGDTVHDGLFVCDGSVLPRSLGVNPALTITAVTERAMILFAKDHDRTLDVGLSDKRRMRNAAPDTV